MTVIALDMLSVLSLKLRSRCSHYCIFVVKKRNYFHIKQKNDASYVLFIDRVLIKITQALKGCSSSTLIRPDIGGEVLLSTDILFQIH